MPLCSEKKLDENTISVSEWKVALKPCYTKFSWVQSSGHYGINLKAPLAQFSRTKRQPFTTLNPQNSTYSMRESYTN